MGEGCATVGMRMAFGRTTLKEENMAKRAKDWNEGLAKDLKNSAFAKQFIKAALDEGLPVQEVMGKVIRAYGIKEFSKRTKISSPNLLRAINPRHNPTQETLNRLLQPFGLRLSVAPIESKIRKSAA